MKETNQHLLKGISLGIISSLLILALMGAVRNKTTVDEAIAVIPTQNKGDIALAQNNRYQISSCAFLAGTDRKGGYGVFVVDTATGVTKAAYVSFVDNRGRTVSVNQFGKPFSMIKTGKR
ncbi:MAG TPA: hypothetical protein ENK84_11145 [Desulfobulbus sp.]|nr:hypothetical protein [Desulfobulbus sp.]